MDKSQFCPGSRCQVLSPDLGSEAGQGTRQSRSPPLASASMLGCCSGRCTSSTRPPRSERQPAVIPTGGVKPTASGKQPLPNTSHQESGLGPFLRRSRSCQSNPSRGRLLTAARIWP